MTFRGLLVVALAAGAYLTGSITGWVSILAEEESDRPWQTFDLVLASADVSGDSVDAALTSAGGVSGPRIGPDTATVLVADFLAGEVMTLARAGQRFDSVDPRFDPFLQSADQLFTVRRQGEPETDFSIHYVPRIERPQPVARSLARGDEQIWLLAAADRRPVRIISVVAAAAAVVLSAALVRRRRVYVLAALVPIVPHAIEGGPLAVVAAGFIVIAWAHLLDRSYESERESFVYGRVVDLRSTLNTWLPAAVVVPLYVVLAGAAGSPLPALSVVLALAGLRQLATILLRRRLASAEHRPFTPRPILSSRYRQHIAAGVGRALVPALVPLTAAALAIFAISLPAGRPPGLEVPTAVELAAAPVGTVFDPAAAPLSTSGLLAHRALHTSILYGGTFRVPQRGDTIEITRARVESGELVTFAEPVVRFDAEWFDAELTSDGGASVYELFRREGGAVQVIWRTPPAGPVGPANPIAILVFVVIAGIAGAFVRLPYRDVVGTVRRQARSPYRPT